MNDNIKDNITIYPYESLGSANHGWLDTKYHFSFSGYRNQDRMEFGSLRVINDDKIMAGSGFDRHPHKDMEIITYVRKGAITHKDSMDNEGTTKAGDVQVMSAGFGVFHSEYNLSKEETTLYQIWIKPNKFGIEPRWDSKEFPKETAKDSLHLLVSGRSEDAGKNALFINQDAAIYAGKIRAGDKITQTIKYQAYILVSEGSILLNDKTLKSGDGAEVVNLKNIVIEAAEDSEVLVIDVPLT